MRKGEGIGRQMSGVERVQGLRRHTRSAMITTYDVIRESWGIQETLKH